MTFYKNSINNIKSIKNIRNIDIRKIDIRNIDISNINISNIKDNKGLLTLFDGIIATLLLFLTLFAFNSLIYFESPSYDRTFPDSKLANDAIELMTTERVDDYSVLYSIVLILKNNNNTLDYTTRSHISTITGDFLNKIVPDKNYILVENNMLNGEIISSKGYMDDNSNISSSTRNVGEYSFTLSLF
ncbi:MAG: hypothetical protein ISP01_02880 [Methanobrevibacter arboriphilus]|uniref:Uncharacterized protein n=1 Tax=Methanobrevibacter arboriphilus TaxID=39441 RepID=A0A843ALB8_METAZ|nr:hypothetical protein [Methanobrevibacter arboriphilus]MBF4468328.1 hypothetical protein [Methanobrevibacter arboriphilus]